MAENSKIEWTTHTLSGWLRISPKLGGMRKIVTPYAKRNSITSIEANLYMSGEWPNVVGIKIPTRRIPAMRTRETVAPENIVTPPFQFSRRAQPATFDALSVNVSRTIGTTRRILSRLGADFCLRLRGVFFADPITGPSLGCGTHLCPTFIRHALTLHWRNEGRSSFQPAFFGGIASGKISHG